MVATEVGEEVIVGASPGMFPVIMILTNCEAPFNKLFLWDISSWYTPTTGDCITICSILSRKLSPVLAGFWGERGSKTQGINICELGAVTLKSRSFTNIKLVGSTLNATGSPGWSVHTIVTLIGELLTPFTFKFIVLPSNSSTSCICSVARDNASMDIIEAALLVFNSPQPWV